MHTSALSKYVLRSHNRAMKKIGFISVPENTRAILWDMDGVVIDSLGLDVRVSNELLQKYFGGPVGLTREYIASIFAYSIPAFWALIFEKIKADFSINVDEKLQDMIIQEYTMIRQKYPFAVLPGIEAALADAKRGGIRNAVVSNNQSSQIKEILTRAGLLEGFDVAVGYDSAADLQEKPAPDMYLYAMRQLGVTAENSVVVEDSLIGAESGKSAGCFTVGVATGALSIEELRAASGSFDLII